MTDTMDLIMQLSGTNSAKDCAIIKRLAESADSALVEYLRCELIDGHWPRSNALATALSAIDGEDATRALLACLKAKRHHVRTAAINALLLKRYEQLPSALEPMLNDSSYETRMAAKEAIMAVTGQEIKTGRGE